MTPPTRNRLLLAMQSDDRDALVGVGQRVELSARLKLESPARDIEHIYFLESGMASIVYPGKGDKQVDVGLIGYEGCTGCSVIQGINRTPQGIAMQIQGHSIRVPVDKFQALMNERSALRAIMLSYVHTVIIQRDETALAATKGSLTQRLARWLLMAQDRLCGGDVKITHDVLSLMLGVRRAGVTTTLAQLRNDDLIAINRGMVRITNRKGLEAFAGIYYGGPEREYDRLFGSPSVDILAADAAG